MELIEPRSKKHCRLATNLPLPLIWNNESLYQIKGVFNGFSVLVENVEDMKRIVSMGYFGKANFSRSYPQFSNNKTEILRARQFKRRKCLSENSSGKINKKVIVVPDSDEDIDDYFTNLKPEYQMDSSGIKESVWLSLEEAFFLATIVNCLVIYHETKIMSSEKSWKLFSETDPYFVHNYLVYRYFRAKNWVVKSGIKFGGDYLLYKQGPPFYHASYVVIIDFLNHKLERIKDLARRSMDNVSLLSLNRLCETAGKELLICQITLPPNEIVNPNNLSNVLVKEILVRRWMFAQQHS